MTQSYGNTTGYTVQMEGPFGDSGTTGKTKDITVYAGAWKGAAGTFSQVVEADFVSANSIVELQPTAVDLAKLFSEGIALVAENDGGEVTIHAIGSKPDWNMTIQCTTREVVRV